MVCEVQDVIQAALQNLKESKVFLPVIEVYDLATE